MIRKSDVFAKRYSSKMQKSGKKVVKNQEKVWVNFDLVKMLKFGLGLASHVYHYQYQASETINMIDTAPK